MALGGTGREEHMGKCLRSVLVLAAYKVGAEMLVTHIYWELSFFFTKYRVFIFLFMYIKVGLLVLFKI